MAPRIPDAEILEAALRVIVKRGFGGATTREIATAAGINEVTLFRRFGSKAELIREAIRREVDAFAADGGAAPTGDLAHDLERVVTLYQRLVKRRGPLIPIVLSEAVRDRSLLAALQEPQRLIASVAALLSHYQAQGELTPEPPLTAATTLLAPLLLQAIVRNLPPAMRPPALDAKAHVRTFLHGRRR